MNELQELLKYHRPFHSDLQIDRWIIGKSGCTDYGMFKQALRELSSRYEALKNLWLDISDTRAKKPTGTDLVRQKMRLESQEAQFADTAREFYRFMLHARDLRKRLPELSPETVERLDAEEWYAQLERMAAVECVATGRVSQSTFDAISALDEAPRKQLMQAALFPENTHISNLLSRASHVPQIPHAAVDIAEIRRMIGTDVARYSLESREFPQTSLDGSTPPAIYGRELHAVSGGWSDSKLNP